MKQEKKQNSKGGQKDMKKNLKRFISIIMVMAMVFAMAAGCGKKEEAATDKDEPKTEATAEDQAESEDETSELGKEESTEVVDDGVMKTGDDSLTEEDIQNLKDSIRDAVISEYLEPNKISAEEFVWPDSSDVESWEYFAKLVENFKIEYETGVEMPASEEELTSSKKILKASFNGIMNWLDEQGSYDGWYFVNTMSTLDRKSVV